MTTAARTWTTPEPAIVVARVVAGALFVIAGLSKIGEAPQLAEDIANFHLVPGGWQNAMAVVLPWIELLAGGAMLTGVRGRAGAWLATAMMVVFTLAVVSAMARGLDIACGCFGTLDAPRVGTLKLAENGALLLVCLLASQRRP